VTKKAYELFLSRNGAYALDVEDWLAAEKQLLVKPVVELKDRRDLFVVRLALAGVDPDELNILATPDDVLVFSRGEAGKPRVFRVIRFPQAVNPLRLHATHLEWTLVLIAPKMAVSSAFEAAPAPASTQASRTARR
jgi:HSP20 family molecular chaperone IbpA